MVLTIKVFYLFLNLIIASCYPTIPFDKRGNNDGYIELVMAYQDYSFYYIEAQVGSPLKTYNFFVDLASSDMLVGYPNVTDWCQNCGSFKPEISTTFLNMNTSFTMNYVSGDVSGFKGKETVSIGGNIVNDLEISVVTEGNLGYPMLIGLAPVGSENIYLPQYPNLGVRLYQSGAVHKNMFSIYGGTQLGTDDARLVFGGVDIAKFSGNLHELDMVKQIHNAAEVNNYWVNLNKFVLSSQNKTIPLLKGYKNFTAIFDSGTSTLLVPNDLYSYLVYEYFNVTDPDNDLVSCQSNDFFTIGFDNFEHRLPVESILFPTGNNKCIIGLQPGAPHDTNIYFGIPVLQSLYTVFDTQSSKIYVAPIQVTNESDIKVIYNDTNILSLKSETKESSDASSYMSDSHSNTFFSSNVGQTNTHIFDNLPTESLTDPGTKHLEPKSRDTIFITQTIISTVFKTIGSEVTDISKPAKITDVANENSGNRWKNNGQDTQHDNTSIRNVCS